MAIANGVCDFFHLFRDHKKVYMCKNQYVFSFLPFHMIDKHNPIPQQKLHYALDRPRNMYIATFKVIRSLISKGSGVLGQNLMRVYIQMVLGEL